MLKLYEKLIISIDIVIDCIEINYYLTIFAHCLILVTYWAHRHTTKNIMPALV